MVKISIPAKIRDAAKAKKLSPRETQVVALLARGETRKATADKLGISHHTVENHLRRIFFKLDAHSTTAVVFILA